MKQQVENAIKWIKEQPIQGCITGSCLLDYFEGADVDVFVYNEKSFNKILFAMFHNPMFTILDEMENWKFQRYINVEEKTYSKFGITTIKFTYNTCIDINVVLKKNCNNIFSVLSSFDMDIICKGYDIEAKEYLDLTNGGGVSKIASWNRWNPMYHSDEVWAISRVLRQLERTFKYSKRGYNTDAVVIKYMELIDNIERYESIFASENFNEKLKLTKLNISVLKQLCEVWLKTHTISDDEIKLLKETIKLL
jgi:hypothetical protein